MEIKKLIEEAHENAKKHGFWEDWDATLIGEKTAKELDKKAYTNISKAFKNNAVSTRLMLIVSELAEAQEGLRHGDMDNFREELADVAIRLADLCGGLGIDLEAEIKKKMEKNRNRPYKHGKAF